MKLFDIFLLKILGIYFISMNNFGVHAKTVNKRGVMDNFNDGLKFAGQMFGINTAADVANLVAKAFSTTATRKKPDIMSIFQRFNSDAENTEQEQQQQQQQRYYQTSSSQEQTDNEQQHAEQSERNSEALPPTAPTPLSGFNAAGLITGILKMIGFDAGKLGALALNAIIMVAQAIGSTLMGTAANRKRVVTTVEGGRFSTTDNNAANSEEAAHAHEPRAARSGNPIDWFLENPNEEMRKLLGDINDVKLSDKVINMIEEIESEPGEGACIKMLMCKSSPFIWGMQKSLAKRLNNTSIDVDDEEEDKYMNVKAFFTHLPSLAEFRHHGAKCEQRYSSQCNTTNVYNH